MFLLCQVWLIKHLTNLFIIVIYSKLYIPMVKTELCTLMSRETCGILLVAIGVLFLRGSTKVIKTLLYFPSMACEEWLSLISIVVWLKYM